MDKCPIKELLTDIAFSPAHEKLPGMTETTTSDASHTGKMLVATHDIS